MSELSKQSNPVQPVDHTHAPGQSPDKHPNQDQGTKPPPDQRADTPADHHQTAQPDQKRAPSDTSHAPGQPAPSAAHPDVQNYMNLDKQNPHTPPQPETAHAAEIKHPAETEHSADVQHGPTQAAENAPGAGSGAHDRATDTRATREAHETPADRELRMHLQPFGVTPEQARDYMRIALVPQLQLNPMTKMTIDDIQLTGNAVSHLPAQQLDHLTTQAKALDAGAHPARQTIDLSHLPAVPRFNVDPAPPFKLQQMPQLRIGPPDPLPNNPFKQPPPKPADTQNDLAKKTADYAAQGNPSHRVAEVPDSERVTEGDWGKLVDLTKDATGVSKLAHILEANASHLPQELAHKPVAAAAAIIAAVSIVGGGTVVDMGTRHPINPDAPSPTVAAPTSALGQALDSHLAAQGGLEALNMVLGLLGDHPKIVAGVDVDPGTRASKDGTHPATRGEVKGFVGVEFEF